MSASKVVVVVVSALAALLAWGCGGTSTDGAGCGATAACGGDVVGTWELQSACFDPASVGSPFKEPACAGAMQSPSTTATGTYTFGSDGTLTTDLTVDSSVTVALTSDCMKALMLPTPYDASCTKLGSSVASQLGMGGSGAATTAACTYSSSQCSCVMQNKGQKIRKSERYTTSGKQIVNGTGGPATYCVSGGTLTITDSADAGVGGTLVLRKR